MENMFIWILHHMIAVENVYKSSNKSFDTVLIINKFGTGNNAKTNMIIEC